MQQGDEIIPFPAASGKGQGMGKFFFRYPPDFITPCNPPDATGGQI